MRLIYLGVVLLAAQLVACAKGDEGVGGSGGSGAFAGFGGTNTDGGGGLSGGSTGGVGNVGNSGGTAGVGNSSGTGGTAGTAGTAGSGGGGPCTPPVSGGQCDTYPQCGCPAGQACDVTSPATGTTQCVSEGTVGPYQKCGSNQFCKAGYACVGSSCKQFCEQTTDCPKGVCFQVMYDNSGTSTPVPGMKVCSSGCALENPQAICGAGLGCYTNNDTPPNTDCAQAGSATGPGGCTATPQNDPTLCAPGYACLQTGDCRKWCRVGFSTDCPSAGACTGFGTPLFVDGLEYGVCP